MTDSTPNYIFNVDPPRPGYGCTKDYTRYLRSVKGPPFYGLPYHDYNRDHKPTCWPPGTEYQYAFCANYKGILPRTVDEEVKRGRLTYTQCPRLEPGGEKACWLQGAGIVIDKSKECKPKYLRPENKYELIEPTPIPLLDVHQTGSVYKPGDQASPSQGGISRTDKSGTGVQDCLKYMEKIFTPNYRYRDWIDRPLEKLKKEVDSKELLCRIPDVSKKHWDFYNVIRMNRDSKEVTKTEMYRNCRVIPIPLDRDVPDIAPLESGPYLGKFNKTIDDTPFNPNSRADNLAREAGLPSINKSCQKKPCACG